MLFTAAPPTFRLACRGLARSGRARGRRLPARRTRRARQAPHCAIPQPYRVPVRPSVFQRAGRPRGSLELHELKEAFDRAAKTWPKWRTFAIPEMTDSVITDPMAVLEQAIKASNSARFTAAYEQSTVACNTSYRSADRGVIVIQSPAGSPCADRDFQPVKE